MAKTPVIIFKVTKPFEHLKAQIKEAARLCGLNASAFIRQACIEKINRVLGK